MKNKLTLAHVLPPDIEQGRSIVSSWIRTKRLSEIRLLHLVQVAAFIKIDLIPPEFRDASLKGLISIALVKGSEQGALRAAFIDPESEYVKELSMLLEDNGVPVYMGNFSEEKTVKRFLEERVVGGLNSRRKSACLAGVTNMWERKLITLVKEALAIRITKKIRNDLAGRADLARFIDDVIDLQNKKIRVYEEIALMALIDGSDLPGWDYLRRYRVDILVASAPPTSMPLLVIEYDGQQHDGGEQAWKDGKRDKVLLDASIPVLRISSKNVRCAGDIKPENSFVYRFLQRYVRVLVSQLGTLIYFHRIESRLRFDPINDAVAMKLKSLCDEYRERESRIDIPPNDFTRLYEAASEWFDYDFNEVSSDLASENFDIEQAWRRWQDPEDHFRHGDKMATVTVEKGPSICGTVDTKDGFSVNMTLRVNGTLRSGTSPRIFVELKRPAGYDELVNVATEAAVICLLEDMARGASGSGLSI